MKNVPRCWVCWKELAKKDGEYSWVEVSRPGNRHLKVHKCCKSAALNFLQGRQPMPVTGACLGEVGCYVCPPRTMSDDLK